MIEKVEEGEKFKIETPVTPYFKNPKKMEMKNENDSHYFCDSMHGFSS